ncbi:cysteine-rich receptor-like protein kinase 25 isoform X2 [Juglans microcarpa x Juglans regia]|uniref:cysteine-rich receptor-like protein kinase 25 isoform X2 n=1 Tax=Juglans microcarpa x Juglans regia TaxID=2249226 RepID=UPI001B7E7C31|nr:cysteine-rich receptor-like protein kinase 25 isoform X2 [Juglans microcarpa x Juglans regia]
MGLPSFDVSMILIMVLYLLGFLNLTSAAVPNYRVHVCPNDTTYTPNSTYQVNLSHLLSSLSSNATREGGFYNATAGQTPDTSTYGLFLCRGDLSTDVCRDCVAFAATEIVRVYCPVEKVAVIWYDECMLRYSNRSIFSTMQERPGFFMWNTRNATQPDQFRRLVVSTLNDLVPRAANATSGAKKFAVKAVTNASGLQELQTLYSLVQCTPDINSSDCSTCLREGISSFPNCGPCDGKQGGRILRPSCNVRFETYPFYLTDSVAAPAPTPIPVLLPPARGKDKISTLTIVIIVASIAVSLVIISVSYCFLRRRARKKKPNALPEENANEITTVESLQFDFATIEAATNKFSDDNKLGGGGFGEVYKGTFPNGQDIAVKRLSGSSEQGAEEFKNEIVVVAKLQHRNLVRLLGFCLEGGEKMLVYKFVPNKSLDYFLFGPDKQRLLDWSSRYKIIRGIARGILYIHEDSRLKVIHRDLKASNILLDKNMNPKISDFGMARLFGVDQTEGNTNRIVGTYGYMSPEYAMQGQFSAKSDVYSFGVLVLEILSGKNNASFYESDTAVDLLTYAWKHWSNGTSFELLDPTLGDSYAINEVIQCIHIGLLCVQENPEDRPTMASIVVMLESYSVTLPTPEKPAFFLQGRLNQSSMPTKELESDQSSSKSIPLSVDESKITEVYPR